LYAFLVSWPQTHKASQNLADLTSTSAALRATFATNMITRDFCEHRNTAILCERV